MLEPGDPAPDVTARNQHGESISPTFTDPTVVYFYPEDGTPGCTTEAEQFARERETYDDAGVTVYGVSTDDAESHREFATETGVEFDLLADPDGEVAAAFGVPLDAPGDATPRTTFVLTDGTVERVHTGVNPDGHARDLLLELLDDGVVALE
ncbi:peroxiredoxin Q/BCP [Halorientalis persicus]|jgi:peroxiredoxin Q/BCP|uniref:thioredoxin-dependent peroxiredoxin n=1 Tax=Halorientalis persicus TaxID=1367881 RepID=A0A1H8IUB1_9EURY|nr:peroxiredoxin [Halorientalis persicus]SEN71949.1 peroxiredoxin Q/BCP [Halorientalis persicus]